MSNRLLTTARCATKPRGFSLLEVMVAASLTGVLLLMISGFSLSLGRTMTDTIAQARLAAEANLALETIRRDFRGSLPGSELGPRDEGLVVGRLTVGSDRLMLCFDGGTLNGQADWALPDRVIRYERQDDQLIRIDVDSGSSFVVADHVSDFAVRALNNGFRINLQLSFRGFTRDYLLITRDP